MGKLRWGTGRGAGPGPGGLHHWSLPTQVPLTYCPSLSASFLNAEVSWPVGQPPTQPCSHLLELPVLVLLGHSQLELGEAEVGEVEHASPRTFPSMAQQK